MIYAATLDNLSKVVTISCCALIGVLTVLSITSLMNVSLWSSSFFFYLVLTISLIAIPVLCYLFSIQEYRLDNKTLYISRVLNSVAVNIDDINNARLLTTNDTTGMIRTFGVGGLFGYFGRFYTRMLGSIYLYTTQRKNRILITTKKGLKIVISPDNLQLLEVLRGTTSTLNDL